MNDKDSKLITEAYHKIYEAFNDLVKDVEVDNIVAQLKVPKKILEVVVASFPPLDPLDERREMWGISQKETPEHLNKDGSFNDIGIRYWWNDAIRNMTDELSDQMGDYQWSEEKIISIQKKIEHLSIPVIKALLVKFAYHE